MAMQVIYTKDINAHGHELAEAQQADGFAAIIDMANELDPLFLETQGVDFDNVYIAQPEDNEQAIDIVEALHKSGQIELIVTTQTRRRYEG